jgi:SAM-dependent methyltransferase
MITASSPTAFTAIADTNRAVWQQRLTAYSYRHADELMAPERTLIAEMGRSLESRHGLPLAKARLLDLGIGTGRTTGHLAAACESYVGIDYSAEMVRRAKDRFPALDIREMDARDLSAFAAASFDAVVFSFNGLDYVGHRDRLLILAQIRRVLRPGGAFLLSSHNRDSAIAPAWSLSNLKLGGGLRGAVTGIAKYLIGIANAARLARRQRREAEYALLNDSAAQYSLITYYISPGKQAAQLERAGFLVERAAGLDGTLFDWRRPLAPGARPDYMIHYLARRV